MQTTDNLHLLLIEDNRADARYFEELLREAISPESRPVGRRMIDGTSVRVNQPPEFTHTMTLREGLDNIDQEIDAILLDLNLPDSRGLETLSRVTDVTDRPVVVLTGLQERELGIEAIRKGAEDYLVKDEVNSDLLLRSVFHAIERREHERQLRQYESLIERSTDVNLIVDRDGYIRYITPSVERVLGYSQTELVGDQVFDYVHEADRAQAKQSLETIIEDDSVPPIEYRVEHADGGNVILEARGRNLLDDPLVAGIVIYTRDITNRVARERKLEEFAQVVSHDLRNPLGIAQTYLQEAIRSGNLADLDEANAALERMDTLIDSLLALAREGETIDETEVTDLESVIEAAWFQVESREATLVVDEDIGSVEADPERLQTLFENLFRNAVEHVGSDVSVHIARYTDRLIIEDDGEGIDPELAEDIFEFGYSTGGGTGTGLAIVRAIARAHEWDITLQGDSKEETRFEIRGFGPFQPTKAT